MDMTAHSKIEADNPHPTNTLVHAMWHLWRSSVRNAQKSRRATEQYEEAARHYRAQLVSAGADPEASHV
jgi:hypothetical protein